ncbi:acyltransferase family protein [Croceibacterium ferulae]|uniref:acyltransferase family protein n=1 Tax=Croceibacterium ferulae TaxID=1854641 RepID=UPI000EAE6137|nr:acyltransferase [Croceibacterium ferulae]
MTPPEDHRRYRDLDGIRGILSVVIVLGHFGLKSFLHKVSGGVVVTPAFPVIVDFFFVLSGFVLAKSYVKRPRPIGEALIERVFRLLPCHMVVLALLFTIRALMIWGGTDPAVLKPVHPAPLAAEFFGLYIFFFDGFPGWNQPSWSVNVQVYITVLLGLGVLQLWRIPRVTMFAAFALLVVAQGWLSCIVTPDVYYPIMRGFVGISLGAVLAAMIDRGFISVPTTRWFVPLFLCAFAVLIVLRDLAPIIAMFTPIFITLIMVAGTRSHSVLSLPPLLKLGDLSFSIYIVHMPVWVLVHWLVDLDGIMGSLAFKAVWLMVVLAAAWVLTEYVEKPGVRLGRKLLGRKRAVSQPA